VRADNLMFELGNLFLDDIALAFQRSAPAFKLAKLCVPDFIALGIMARLENFWDDWSLAIEELDGEARLGCPEYQRLPG
jgi:hypothetical protein